VTTTQSSLSRKVTTSGVIWLNGRSYYVSRRLAGQVIPLRIVGGRLIIDVVIPLQKVYRLPNREATHPAPEDDTASPSPRPAEPAAPARGLDDDDGHDGRVPGATNGRRAPCFGRASGYS